MLRYVINCGLATIDDPEWRNPMSAGAMADTLEAVQNAAASDEVRVLGILDADTRAFIAGADLRGRDFVDADAESHSWRAHQAHQSGARAP